MYNLSSYIRSLILSDTIASSLALFNGERAVFTRRPTPPNATYPLIVINPAFPTGRNDYITCINQVDLVYDIIVYGQNDTPAHYREVEDIAFALSRKFARLGKNGMTMPAGAELVQAVGNGPFPAPTDDLNKVARAISITFTITTEQ